MKYRSGFIAVVGRPNVGKSTLLNRVLGEKILIVSNKPQTTRNKIRCIYTEPNLQVVFLDTPGIHKPHHKLGQQLVDSSVASLKEVDQVWYVVEPDTVVGKGDQFIIEHLPKNSDVVLIVNKIDSVSPAIVDTALGAYKNAFHFNAAFSLSAVNGDGVEALLHYMREKMPEGPQYYPDDMIIDQPERFVAGEIIREKILELTRDEIPHSCAVLVEGMQDKGHIVHVTANIYVERDSQKGIIIGKQGSMLQSIGTAARADIEALLGSRVHLELWVKVRKDWRNKDSDLRMLGYDKEK